MSKVNPDRDTSIEYDALDIEWLKYSSNFHEWLKLSTNADELEEEAKRELEKTDAFIDLEIRASYEGSDKKLTENMIKSKILLDERHVEAQMKYNDAHFNARRIDDTIKSLTRKQPALENLVKLMLAGYFAGPKEPRDLQEKFNAESKVAERTRGRLRRGEI